LEGSPKERYRMIIPIELLMWIVYLISLYFSVFWLLVLLDVLPLFKEEQKKNNKLSTYPIISVLIPAYNEQDTIIPTLQSVINLDYPKEKLEVLVLDDGSDDKTFEKAQKFAKNHPTIKVLTHKNMGKAASLNRGLKLCKGEFFACLDADSFVDRKTLLRMLSLYYSKNDKDVAIITPAMKVHNPKKLIQKVQSVEYLLSIYFSRLMAYLDCIYVAPGPFSLYRTAIIRRLGGFDEHNLTEDQEIAYRSQCSHYKILHCHNGYVYTKAPATVKAFYKQRNRWYKGSILNVMKYKKILLNSEYGDFGHIQMTKNLLLFFLCVLAIGFAFHYLVWPLIVDIHHLYLVNFDFWPYLNNFKLTFRLLNIDLQRLFVLMFLFMITLIFFLGSYRNAKENIRKRGFLHLIPYFLIYYLIKSIISLLVIIELLIGKKQKW
jgi:cellulose synthase/poly-beta-1,6-N-acetylglucosamine synthase-like glycosyltransferase